MNTKTIATLDDRSVAPPKPTVMVAYINGVLREFSLKK